MGSRLIDRLPVDELVAPLRTALMSGGCAVVNAPTGSGKSTRLPQILFRAGVLEKDRRIVVLQPRRMAARMLARRVAWEFGCQLGEHVGYHIRFDRVYSAKTRILFITEGILLGMLAEDPRLESVGVLVFDEFHERHLHSDLGIALARSLQASTRPDLKIVVMSATLDTEHVSQYLAPCPVLRVDVRQHPVEVCYAGEPARDRLGRESERIWDRAAREFASLAAGGLDGHTLIFMPGAYEIARTVAAIQASNVCRGVKVYPLHGALPPAQQDAAIEPTTSPKVIVATNVAETSLTIEGVTTVIDSGLARISRFDPKRGIDTLLVEKIDRAAADQRAGRAGRTSPGRCLRLWSEAAHARRPIKATPEVARVDLAETLLALMSMGYTNLHDFPWLEAPSADSQERALRLLAEIGAVASDGGLTEVGRMMARIPAHPRLARLLIEGMRYGILATTVRLAAMLQGRPLLERQATTAVADARSEIMPKASCDVTLALALWQAARDCDYEETFCRNIGLRAGAAREADRVAEQLSALVTSVSAKSSGATSGPSQGAVDNCEALGRSLVAAFADHIARRDHAGTLRCSLTHERRGELTRDSLAREAKVFVACEIEETQRGNEVVVLLSMASAIEQSWIEQVFPNEFLEGIEVIWDASRREVVARQRVRFRGLLLDDQAGGAPNLEKAAGLLAQKVCSGELKLEGWDGAVENWIARVNFVAAAAPDLGIAPIDQEAKLMLTAEACVGATSYREIKQRQILPALKNWLSREQRQIVEQAAPETITLPGRSRPLRIRYEPHIPRAIVSAKLQDFYDVPQASLMIVFGRVALTVELLAPNGRPAQITNDLDAFWKTSYPMVKKDLKGRYPKHEWR